MQPCILHAMFYSQFPSGLKIMLYCLIRHLRYLYYLFLLPAYMRMASRALSHKYNWWSASRCPHICDMRKRITLSQIDVRKLSHGRVQFKLSRHVKELKIFIGTEKSEKRARNQKWQKQKEAKCHKNEICFQLHGTSKYHFLNLNARNATLQKKYRPTTLVRWKSWIPIIAAIHKSIIIFHQYFEMLQSYFFLPSHGHHLLRMMKTFQCTFHYPSQNVSLSFFRWKYFIITRIDFSAFLLPLFSLDSFF